MIAIPTKQQIARNFRRDVTLKGWRKKWSGPTQPVVTFTGAQKEFFDYLMQIAARCEAARHGELARLETREDVMRRAAGARRMFRACQGLAKLPERTPLRPRVTPAFERAGFRVEHVILESRPRYYVTGNLYLPTRYKPPYPAALHVPGHSENGKAHYQLLCSVLPRKGIAVFCPDPAGQGERDEYVDLSTGRRTVRRACRMHGVAGDPAFLIGSNFGAYRLWDCMRCIDYLQSRRDIAGDRIGVTGISGGGWEALWLGAIDTRVKAVNSNCYLTTWRRRMENRGADAEPDPEQDPFGVLASGLDAADLIVACAPRPVSLGATLFDFFPVDGALACYAEAKRIYALAGIEDRLVIQVSNAGHALTPEMRKLCCCWLQKWLMGEKEPDVSEPDWESEDESLLNCTRTGAVLTSLGGKTTAQLNAERARELALTRPAPHTRRQFVERSADVRKRLKELLRFEAVGNPLEVENERAAKVGLLRVTPVRIRSDGGLWLQGYLWERPGGAGKKPAVICVAEKKSGYDHLNNTLCRRLALQGAIALDLDPRGMGPLAEVWLDFVPLVESDLTYDAFLLGRTVLGMRVADIMRGVDMLTETGMADKTRIGVVGNGYGALLGLFTACLDARISRLVECRCLTSYSALAWHREYAWPANAILPHVLEHFDLEDARAAFAPRRLLVVEPLDHCKRPLASSAAAAAYRQVATAYRAMRSAAAFRLAACPVESSAVLAAKFLTA